MARRTDNAMVVVKKFRQKKYKAEVEKALPEPRILARFLRLAADALAKNPKLGECDEDSLRTSIMEAAHLGVVLDGTLGHGSILPFKGKAKFALGYKGYIELALRSGRVNHVETAIVREHDDFAYQLGTDAWLRHIPKSPMDARGKRIGAWCMVVYPNGLKSFDYMHAAEIEAIRLKSPSGRKDWSAWINHPDEMWRKTVTIRHMKSRGISEVVTASASLEEAYNAGLGRTQKEIEAEVVEQDKFADTMGKGKDVLPAPAASEPAPESKGAPRKLTKAERQDRYVEYHRIAQDLGRKSPALDRMDDAALEEAVKMMRRLQSDEQRKTKPLETEPAGDSEPSVDADEWPFPRDED